MRQTIISHRNCIFNDEYTNDYSILSGESGTILTLINGMMSGSKAPDFDAYGLLRATHSHNPTQYSHIVGLSSHFYAHIGAGPKVFHPPMSKLMWA